MLRAFVPGSMIQAAQAAVAAAGRAQPPWCFSCLRPSRPSRWYCRGCRRPARAGVFAGGDPRGYATRGEGCWRSGARITGTSWQVLLACHPPGFASIWPRHGAAGGGCVRRFPGRWRRSRKRCRPRRAVAARERREYLAAGGDHRAHLPCFTHRWRICSGRFMSGRWSREASQLGARMRYLWRLGGDSRCVTSVAANAVVSPAGTATAARPNPAGRAGDDQVREMWRRLR